jgi:hypothetical protein
MLIIRSLQSKDSNAKSSAGFAGSILEPQPQGHDLISLIAILFFRKIDAVEVAVWHDVKQAAIARAFLR